MPIVTTCPDCARKLRVPDQLLGKKVRCPGCKVVFTAADSGDEPQAAPPATEAPRRPALRGDEIEQTPHSRRAPPPPDEGIRQGVPTDESLEEVDDQPRGRRQHEDDDYGDDVSRGGKKSAWSNVGSGITWVLAAIVMSFLFNLCGGAVGAVIGATSAASRAGGPGAGPNAAVAAAAAGGSAFFVLAIVMNVLQVFARGADLYGHFLGMAVPDKPGSGLRGLSVATFGLFSASAVLLIPSSFLSLVAGATAGSIFVNPFAGTGLAIVSGIMSLVGGICYLAAWIVFLLYLQSVAKAVKRKDLGRLLRIFLITSFSVAGVAILVTGIIFAVMGASLFGASANPAMTPLPGGGPPRALLAGGVAMVGFGCLGALVSLGLYIWYIMLLLQVRGAVLEFARRG